MLLRHLLDVLAAREERLGFNLGDPFRTLLAGMVMAMNGLSCCD